MSFPKKGCVPEGVFLGKQSSKVHTQNSNFLKSKKCWQETSFRRLHLENLEQQLAFVRSTPKHPIVERLGFETILSLFANVDERPMDWVKPKHRARQLKSTESTDTEVTASAWLKQLCEENVALLQSSLPIRESQTKSKSTGVPADAYLRATLWGTGVWEVEKPAHQEYLNDLVEVFGGISSPASTTKKSHKSKSPNSAKTAKESAQSSVDAVTAGKIGKWISQQLPKASHDPYVALACAGWIHALPEVGKHLSASLWLEVLQCALTQVDRAWERGPSDGLFPWIIWACEVPLALAKQLSHLGGKDRIVSETLNRIALLLEESADDPRGFMARGGQDLRALLACIMRCRWSADAVGARKWYPPQRKAIGKLAIATLALTDAEGRQLLFDRDDTTFEEDFWIALNELAGENKKLHLASSTALPDAVGKAVGERPAKLRKDSTIDVSMPKQSQYWEKSCIATMRRSWRDRGCRVAIDFSSDVIWLDVLGADGQRVMSGDWDVQVQRNNKPVQLDVSWQEVCWFSDDDVDYLELECAVEDVCKVQRQIMLMRDEGIVYFADALIAENADEWSILSTWTTPDDMHLKSEPKTTEGRLVRSGSAEQTAALLLPVAMPEWRRAPSHGKMTFTASTLSLQCETKAKSLYSPLVMSLRGAENAQAFTWRQLTIAEELQIQPRDIAEAYRVQINRDQWVFYRSLTPCTRRTVMGLHLNTEFYAGRFSRSDGEYEPIVEVNPE